MGFEGLGSQFLDLFEFAESYRHFEITRVTIPMMTVICDTHKPWDISEVYTRCQRDDCLFEVHGTSIAEGRTLMLKHANSPVSLQVFTGGRLQLAGCTSHIDAILMVDFFLDMMQERERLESIRYHIKLLNMTCTLANTQLKISDQGFLRDINAALAQKHPLDHTHRAEKREHYSACVLYMRSPYGEYRLSSRIFSSGCISITGRSPNDCIYMLRFVLGFFDTHRAHTHAPNTYDGVLSRRRDFWSFQSLMTFFNRERHVISHNHLPVRRLVDGCPYCREYGNVYCSDAME
jgi:TATA-box binding protein (TBP) (component of TFIID and TFIIIB)